jgi:hypothetical protein
MMATDPFSDELDEQRLRERAHMTPQQRWRETLELWDFYLAVGGSLDPEPDAQSPFDAILPRGTAPADGRPGLRVVRRGGL